MEVWHIKSKISKYQSLNEFFIIDDYAKGYEFLEKNYQYYSSTDPGNCTVVSKKPYKGVVPESYIDDNQYTTLKEKKLKTLKEYNCSDSVQIYYGKLSKIYVVDKFDGTTKQTETLYGMFSNHADELTFAVSWLQDHKYLFCNHTYSIDGFTFHPLKDKKNIGFKLHKLFCKKIKVKDDLSHELGIFLKTLT